MLGLKLNNVSKRGPWTTQMDWLYLLPTFCPVVLQRRNTSEISKINVYHVFGWWIPTTGGSVVIVSLFRLFICQEPVVTGCNRFKPVSTSFNQLHVVTIEQMISKHHIQDKAYYSQEPNCHNGPLTRYVKLLFAHAAGMPGTFSPTADFEGNR